MEQNKNDFLSKLYLGKYYMSEGRDEDAIVLLKNAIKAYEHSKSNY